MSPTLHTPTLVYATVPSSSPLSTQLLSSLELLFREDDEGWTLVLPADVAAQNEIPGTMFPCRRITLNVHSSLDAVGSTLR